MYQSLYSHDVSVSYHCQLELKWKHIIGLPLFSHGNLVILDDAKSAQCEVEGSIGESVKVFPIK